MAKIGKDKPEVKNMYKRPLHSAKTIATSCALALLWSQAALAAPLTAPDFAPNTPATANSVNQAFEAVENAVNDNDGRITTNTGNIGTNTTSIGTNSTDIGANSISISDHEGRISALEGVVGITSPPIVVNCGADPNAFINTTIEDHTIYELTGMCNGPIEIRRKRNVIIRGDATGSKDDGVILPAGLTTNPNAAIFVRESNVELQNLTVDASNYVTNNYSFGVEFVLALGAGMHSITRVSDVDFIGGDYGIAAFRQGLIRIFDNVTVTGWNLGGVSASNSAHVDIFGTTTVTSTLSSSSSFSDAVTAWRQAVIEIRNGGTFSGGVATDSYSLSAGENGTIQVRDVGTTTLNGIVYSSKSSSIRVRGGATITGDIWSGENSAARIENSTITGSIDAFDIGYIRLINVTHSGGYIWAGRNSAIRAQGTSSLNTGGSGFDAIHGGNIGLRDTTTVTSNTPLQLRFNGTVYIHDGVNLNSIGITCQSQQNQLEFVTNATLGDLSGCP